LTLKCFFGPRFGCKLKTSMLFVPPKILEGFWRRWSRQIGIIHACHETQFLFVAV
jgi:hypothetical protein